MKAKVKSPKPATPHVSFCMDLELKQAWDSYCESLDINASQLVRRLMREELKNRVWETKLK
jgi:hypothetical protein